MEQETSAESMYLLNLSDETALASGNIVTSSAEAIPTSIDSIEQQMIGSMNVSDEVDQQHQDQRHLLHPRRHEETKQSRSSHQPEDQKKANHSEIEKRRREKMNSCIKELASMIPVCSGMSRKLDKLTVLRMAVQHLKTIRGNMNSFVPDSSQSRPSFLTDKKMYDLILKVAEGFLFVVSCDRGKILFITESVNQVLNYERGDLLGQNLFDILHPKDVAKVKEQLTSSDLLTKKERYVDAKTMLPVSSAEIRAGISDHHHHGGNRGSKTGGSSSTSTNMPSPSPGLSAFSPGARRSFFCRMKCKPNPQIKQEEADTTTPVTKTSKKRKHSLEKKYVVIHCLGYIKSWSSSVTSSSATSSRSAARTAEDDDADSDTCGSFNLSCLVAVGKTIPPFTPPTSTAETSSPSTCHATDASTSSKSSSSKKVPTDDIQFVTRHAMDGKFVFVDQRAVFILGFLPQELLGTSNYEYCHPEDVKNLADSHRLALASKTDVTSKPYRFKTKSGSYVYIQTKWTNFKNPWTKEFEFLVARNTCVPTFDASLVDSSRLDPNGLKSRGDDGNSYLRRHHHHRRESPSSEDGLMASTGLSCLDEMIHNLQSSSSPKSGPSSNENSSGSNSESRVKKLLSSSRVNLWKIGKQIADEALETQRNRFTDTSGDSISSSAGGPRSNVSSNVSSPSLPGSTASDRGSSSGGATVGGNGDSIAKGSLTSSSTGSTGNDRRDGREGGGNGSDSGNSSTYSTNTFYNGSNNMHQLTSQVPSSASSLASQAAANAAAASSSSSNSASNSSTSGFLMNCSGSDPLLASSAVSSLGGLEPMSGVREAQAEEEEAASSSSCPEVPSSTATGGNNIDDAAMALVLSLLESDDGIQEGSSVDFNVGLNWPSF